MSTKNVSMGGVLIDPEINLSFNEDLHMTFIDSKFNGRVYTKGKVIRVDSDGVGIQFDGVVPVMSSL
ncbi:MAG: PilZ domain-containing protein [Deltaproteobacteria bacterium]|nr:PilZ domain-containing protein [Deltaproteobacteria bacterium]